ncbi:MAG: UTP--glucose-1-phosphate uridylyltransferase GalU [Microbacteriaceae bacterium]|nr:UTP--glucose-1-phosphate uridylyltransferase GalU [Microbacteriaceae bacterium]
MTKAVVPAAGLGTRFLPATKALPKEMLPVVDKPAIQYVLEEAVAAGLDDVLMVIGRNKFSIQDHFDAVPELEANLQKKGDQKRLDEVVESSDLADIFYVRQGEPRGLGHAVSKAKSHVEGEAFAVLLGDDLIDESNYVLPDMIKAHEKHGATILALMEVPIDHIHLYGAAAVEKTDDPNIVKVTGLIEKPAAKDAPSNLAVIGRYILQPNVFSVLEETPPGKGGEIQLTDALQKMAVENIAGGVYGVIFRGRRYDTGDKLDYIKAILQIAVDRPDLGPDLTPWLKKFTAEL